MDEAQILIGLKNGDKRSWDLLYDLLYRKVYFITQGIVGETMEAEDLAISALVKFWAKGPENFESFLQVKTFIFRTAQNAAFNSIKRSKVQKKRDQEFAYTVNITEEGFAKSAERAALFKVEMLQVLADEIEKLPEQCREAFKLAVIQNIPRPVVAEKLNISLSTVHNHIAHAKKRLRRIFSDRDLMILLLLLGIMPD